MTVRVKICGIKTEAVIDVCAEAGVEMVGLNLWPGSSRYVPPERAAQLVARLPSSIEPVGVFVDTPPEEVARIAARVGLRAVQIHGDAPVNAFLGRGFDVIQVIRVAHASSLETPVDAGVRRVLLDAAGPGHGGAGRQFDWALLPGAHGVLGRDIIVAGGLKPDNVAAAVALARPWGVDVASGVESAPGVKDPALIRAFVQAVRAASAA